MSNKILSAELPSDLVMSEVPYEGFTLEDDLEYFVRIEEEGSVHLEVPYLFHTDLQSSRWPIVKMTGDSRPYVVHDWLYSVEGGLDTAFTRAQSDRILYLALVSTGMSPARAAAKYAAVRAFGWMFFRKA